MRKYNQIVGRSVHDLYSLPPHLIRDLLQLRRALHVPGHRYGLAYEASAGEAFGIAPLEKFLGRETIAICGELAGFVGRRKPLLADTAFHFGDLGVDGFWYAVHWISSGTRGMEEIGGYNMLIRFRRFSKYP